MRNSSTSMAKDNVFPCHRILDHYVNSHVVGGMQGTYVRTVQMLRSRWQLVRIFSSHVLRDLIFSHVDMKSTRIWWDNIWPKVRILLFCIYEFHGSQKNTAQHCRCSQKSWFKTAQRDRCSFGTWCQYKIDVLYCPFRKSEIFKKDLNHAQSLERFTLNVLIIFIWVGKKLLHQ